MTPVGPDGPTWGRPREQLSLEPGACHANKIDKMGVQVSKRITRTLGLTNCRVAWTQCGWTDWPLPANSPHSDFALMRDRWVERAGRKKGSCTMHSHTAGRMENDRDSYLRKQPDNIPKG